MVLIVPDPTAYLGQIEVLRSNRFRITLVLARSQMFAFANHADQIIGWDELLRFAHPSPLPASLPPGLPLPLPANVAPAEPTTSGVPGPNAGEDDWEKELDELLKGMSVQAPCPENVESQPLPTPEQSPELSRSRGLIWDLDDDDGADVHRRKAATVGTTEWQTRLDQASPPHLSSWYSHDVNEGWDDALSAIARQANSPPAPPTPNSTFSRLINAQQQIGSPALNSSAPAPAGVSGPASSDWLDTLLSETASLAASESRSSVPPASSATTSASPSPGSPWITVTRGIKGPAAYEEEKERLFAPLVEAIKLASEQAGGVRRVTRGVVGSELGATAKQKTKFYQGLPPGIDSFKDYTRAAEKAGVVILRNTGDRDGTIEIAPVRQHAKARSLLPPGLAGREVPGLGVSWKAAGKIARGGAR